MSDMVVSIYRLKWRWAGHLARRDDKMDKGGDRVVTNICEETDG